MGYGIVGGFSKKEMYENDNEIINIQCQCQYAYQKYFREAFGCEITDWNGRLSKKDISKFVEGLDKFILMLENGLSVPVYIGSYMGNIEPDQFIKELKELRRLVIDRKVRYLSIG